MNGRSAAIGGFLAASLAAGLMAVTAAAAGVATAEPAGAAAAATTGAGAVKKAGQERPPVNITSDAAEYHNKENMVIFTGSVVASQSGSRLTADRMELVFTPAEGPGGAAGAASATGATEAAGSEGGAVSREKAVGVIGEPTGGRQIKTITALKNVTFRQIDAETKKERYATGEKAVYDADQQLVTMTGNPKLWEGRNVILGEEMIFHIQGQDAIFKGKVNLTVFPDEAKQEKKP